MISRKGLTVPSPRIMTDWGPVLTFMARTTGIETVVLRFLSGGLLAVNAPRPTAPKTIMIIVRLKCKNRLFVLFMAEKPLTLFPILNRGRFGPATPQGTVQGDAVAHNGQVNQD